MRAREISLCVFFMVIYACGPKISKSPDSIIKDTKDYVAKTDANQSLKESFVEGVLTDVSGNKDKGSFQYYTYFDKKTKELHHIKNIEITQKTIEENFYFKDGKLVLITTKTDNEKEKDMYIINGKVLNGSTIDSEYVKVLLNKAKLFQKEFNKSH